MKRTMTLLLALLMVVALFAGCGGKTATTPSSKPSASTTGTPAPNATAAANLVENGKKPVYDVKYDQFGTPTAMFSYEKAKALPLTKEKMDPLTFTLPVTESAITKYSVTSLAELYSYKELYNRTGVPIEYKYYVSTNGATTYAVMFASDAMTDLMQEAEKYYPNSILSGIEEGYFANMYDYLEYMPCYHYLINNTDDDVWNYCYAYNKKMPNLISIAETIYCPQGIVLRKDYLDRLNIKASDITTVSDFYTTLTRFKKEISDCSWPVLFSNGGDMFFGGISGAYGTYGALSIMNTGGGVQVYVVDGKVKFPYCDDAMKAYITEVSKWYKEGLIDPNMTTYNSLSTVTKPMTTGIGAGCGMLSGIAQWKANNENKKADYVGVPNLVLKKGDTLHLKNYTYSHLTAMYFEVSAECKNIPLLASWIDYWYSEEGNMLTNYGIKDLTYTVDASGNVQWTDLITKNPQGLTISDCWTIYATNSIGRRDLAKGNYYAGAAINLEFTKAWENVTYDKKYVYPTAITLSQADKDTFVKYFADLSTYVAENYGKFITGVKPMSEWDAYVDQCKKLKLDECVKIYQNAYDTWMKSKPVRYSTGTNKTK